MFAKPLRCFAPTPLKRGTLSRTERLELEEQSPVGRKRADSAMNQK
nr:MAG TPA: hypothetical protein [Caudoviricetes sp.]